MSRWSLLILRSHVLRSRSNHSSQPTVFSAQYLLTTSFALYQTWCRCCRPWVDDPFVDFQVTCSKIKVKQLISAHCVVRSISFDPFTWSIPNLVQGFDLNIWTCDLKINRDHLLIGGNACTKYGVDQVKGSIDIERTTQWAEKSGLTLTFEHVNWTFNRDHLLIEGNQPLFFESSVLTPYIF